MAASTIGQLAVVGTPTQLANKTTGAESQGGGGRCLANLAGPVFAGVNKLRGLTYNALQPASRLVLLLAQSDPRTVLGYQLTSAKDGKYEFTNLPQAPYIVMKLALQNIEQAQVYDWEIANLP
jgi:hypothetical protein